MDLKALIRDIPDFPKPGILFRDITTLLQNPAGLNFALGQLTEGCRPLAPDYIVGIESRGFIFGMPVADRLGVGFVPVRKPGKLPSEVHGIEYELEYGSDRLEVHCDAFHPGSRVVVVDDLLATGGTARATAELIEKTGAEIAGFAFAIELDGLKGRSRLPEVPLITLVNYP